MSPNTILRFLDRCEESLESLYSFCVVKGNQILSEGYYAPMQASQLKMTHSMSKSINALAVGIALGDGKIHLDDKLVDFFPEAMPPDPDPRIQKITVRDMLMMAASSVATSAAFSGVKGSWKTFYLSSVPKYEPGEMFSYDTGAAYMLSCIVTKVMGKNSLDVLRERVFCHMGIEDVCWLEDAEGNNTGGWGFYMRAKDMCKLGRLFLNYGNWDGQQLIPEWFMREASKKQIDTFDNPGTGWGYGYGYQFWRFPENTFGYFGAFGQLCVCSPEKDMYVVTTGGCTREENRRLLTIITETIFAESCNEPIPYNDSAYQVLKDRLAKLQLPVLEGNALSGSESDYFDKQYTFTPNDTGISRMKIKRKDSVHIQIEMELRGELVSFVCGYKEWVTTEPLSLDTPQHTTHSFSYAWDSEDRLYLKQYMCNSTYYKVYTIVFSPDDINISVSQNIAIGGARAWNYSGRKSDS